MYKTTNNHNSINSSSKIMCPWTRDSYQNIFIQWSWQEQFLVKNHLKSIKSIKLKFMVNIKFKIKQDMKTFCVKCLYLIQKTKMMKVKANLEAIGELLRATKENLTLVDKAKLKESGPIIKEATTCYIWLMESSWLLEYLIILMKPWAVFIYSMIRNLSSCLLVIIVLYVRLSTFRKYRQTSTRVLSIIIWVCISRTVQRACTKQIFSPPKLPVHIHHSMFTWHKKLGPR